MSYPFANPYVPNPYMQQAVIPPMVQQEPQQQQPVYGNQPIFSCPQRTCSGIAA